MNITRENIDNVNAVIKILIEKYNVNFIQFYDGRFDRLQL